MKVYDEKVLRHVTKLFYMVANDSLVGSISAWSAPSRHLASHMARTMNLNADFEIYEPPASELLYLHPDYIKLIRHYIANWLRDQVREEMENAWANVFIQDGSVDISQVDNYFHCARSILEDGTVKYYFISFEEKNCTVLMDKKIVSRGLSNHCIIRSIAFEVKTFGNYLTSNERAYLNRKKTDWWNS